MTSQVIVNIDSELKKVAMAKVKKDWITMKALLGYFLKWYVENKITIWAQIIREYDIEDIQVNKKLQNKMNGLSNLL